RGLMFKPLILVTALIALAAPVAAGAQTSTTEAARERARALAEARAERASDAANARAERARDRAEQTREREAERQERDRAGSLDTVVTFDARGALTVSCPGGEVTVTASDRNEIKVRARTENGSIRFTSNGSRATLETASGRGCSDGRFDITVPAGTRLSASTWSGSVGVRGVHGEIEIRAQSGDITVRDAGDRVDVESLSGDVNIIGVKGETKVNTISGGVELSGARGDVTAETVSGDVTLRDIIAKQVRVHNTSGDISFIGSILDGGRYEFNTHSGELTIGLPADTGAELSISTFSGGIESDFPITLKAGAHGIGASQAKRLNFTLGRGTARIVAESFSGDITLQRKR
ncbi:MAG: DUF4097 family beta strand repeat-containing protein, partial [Gemmatimonadota bacterium]|nr:DUF4097 family beta strand repeat-containing protein [Gemmatimonadota bacterium]